MSRIPTRLAAGPRRPVLVVAGAAVLALLLAGCGDGSRPVATRAPAAPAQTADAALPTLPPVQEVEPERYDAAGCVRVGPTDVSCASTAAEVDAAARGDDPADWRRLAGFEGRWYDPAARAGVPVLLDGTTTLATAGPWTAMGLARNDTGAPIPGLVVGADLLGADGALLETVSAASPVVGIRVGEPVPFRLTATTDAASVASVRWTVTVDGTADGDPAGRDLAVATWWTRDPASGRIVDFPLHTDGTGPLPYLLFGGVENVGREVRTPTVVAAWTDADGRVVALAEAPVVDETGVPLGALAAGGAADVLLVIDDPAAGAAAAATAPMLWGVGR